VATRAVAGPATAVEALWLEPARWPSWVDGFGAVVSVRGEWPEPGAVLDWNSRPGGRGRVRERAVSHVPGTEIATEVEDEQLTGTQTVSFAADGERVRVTLSLDYRLKDQSFLTPVVDALFIRRSMTASLQRTLVRFAQEREAHAAGL
jgi:uncharacterized membrane protein